MTIAKIRNLSTYGVVSDVDQDPYLLPPGAFSMAVNARFRKGSVERAPVFRRVPQTLAQTGPRYLATNTPSSGFDNIIIGYLNGRVYSYKSGAESNLSITAYVDANSETPYTSCRLGDVFYVNRPDRVPWSLRVTDSIFQTLSNWDATWRAKILRSCNSVLCAFGVTKGATSYPTMVKTSQAALVNAVPTSWNEADPTTNAYENIIAEMEGPIMDANALGRSMIVYGLRQTVIMRPTTSNDIWDIDPLFSDAGAINVDCSVEIDSKHYVFGLDDIWVHDGVTKQSICDMNVRKSIFGSMNVQKSGRFNVKYDAARKEIRFNYVSGDRLTYFTGAEGCNRSAVYYIPEGTWTYDDLPFVFGTALANLDSTLTYATVTQTYETIGGSYLDQEDSLKKVLVMLGDSSTPYSLLVSLYAIDQQGPGSTISYPVDTNATRYVVLEHNGIDLDELPEVETMAGYKVVSTIWPRARFETGAQPLLFSFGAANNYNDTAEFTATQDYDSSTQTRCDFNDGGRYFYLKIEHNDYHWFKLSGFDLDIYETGEQ